MPTSNVKRRQKRKSGSGSLVPAHRKKEILGLLLMVLAFLVGLALFTYNAADDAIARDFSLAAALNPGNNRADNALGLVGAVVAYLLVPNFLGYTTLVLTGLLLGWGYLVFRHRTPIYLPLLTVLLLSGAFVAAALFGWIAVVFESQLTLWSGAVGLGIAGWMERLLGTTGSVTVLLSMMTIILLLLVDLDVQKSLDRLEELLALRKEAFSDWWARASERRAERRAEIERRREERTAAAEKDRAPKPGSKDAAAAPVKAVPAPRPAPAPAPPRREERAPPGARSATAAAPWETARPRPQGSLQPREAESVNDLFSGTAAPPPRPRRDAPSGIELIVRERVEEAKADDLQRRPELPEEERVIAYRFPPVDLLDEAEEGVTSVDYAELEENKRVLLDKLDTYNIEITEINAVVGPTVTLYELTPAPGIKISRITALEDDLAMAMAARGIRMIAPIPGKSAIGVEIPNRHRELVPVRDLLGTARFRDAQMELPIAVGKTIEGEVFMQDLTKLPHLLMAGATGSGKSVGLNTLITGLLYACHPANLKFVMIDPKKIELQQYAQMVDHYIAMPNNGDDPIITDFTEALGVLKSCEKEMERRYDLLSKASVRGIKDYNKKFNESKLAPSEGHRHLPYIVVIVDELADLMMTAGKEIEGPIARLAQMARAVGIHLVLATQRPSVDVITGLIKANFPARIAYQVASKIDSRTILDQNGAEGLVGNGDLLYMMGSRIIRLQGPFIGIEEVDRLMESISNQPGPGPYELPPIDFDGEVDELLGVEDTDDLFEEAARIIVRSQQGSVSLLQRKLSVGYTRAARIVDQLEEAGIVGPFVGSKAREVLVTSEAQLDGLLDEGEDE